MRPAATRRRRSTARHAAERSCGRRRRRLAGDVAALGPAPRRTASTRRSRQHAGVGRSRGHEPAVASAHDQRDDRAPDGADVRDERRRGTVRTPAAAVRERRAPSVPTALGAVPQPYRARADRRRSPARRRLQLGRSTSTSASLSLDISMFDTFSDVLIAIRHADRSTRRRPGRVLALLARPPRPSLARRPAAAARAVRRVDAATTSRSAPPGSSRSCARRGSRSRRSRASRAIARRPRRASRAASPRLAPPLARAVAAGRARRRVGARARPRPTPRRRRRRSSLHVGPGGRLTTVARSARRRRDARRARRRRATTTTAPSGRRPRRHDHRPRPRRAPRRSPRAGATARRHRRSREPPPRPRRSRRPARRTSCAPATTCGASRAPRSTRATGSDPRPTTRDVARVLAARDRRESRDAPIGRSEPDLPGRGRSTLPA